MKGWPKATKKNKRMIKMYTKREDCKNREIVPTEKCFSNGEVKHALKLKH